MNREGTGKGKQTDFIGASLEEMVKSVCFRWDVGFGTGSTLKIVLIYKAFKNGYYLSAVCCWIINIAAPVYFYL